MTPRYHAKTDAFHWRRQRRAQQAGCWPPPACWARPGLPTGAHCAPVGSPYIEQTNFAPVERYLARAIAMSGLVEGRLNAGAAPGTLPPGAYRPENWEPDIRLLAELNAAFIQDAAGTWEHPEYFQTQPGPSAYLVAARATVDRINAAYDCAGLRRPIIEAAVFENINPGPAGNNSAVREVIDLFLN